jgi:primary-amine oxidase
MPAAYTGFLLKPNGFFTMNPANDVPPSSKKGMSKGLPMAAEAKKDCCH